MEKIINLPMLFLGAVSKNGFVSDFDKVFNPYDGDKAYILKGGPGTGKSTLMKKIVRLAQEKGERVIVCPCSSDPDSLDAVLLPERRCAVMDGTAPHVVEPKYPILCEEIINLGECADSKAVENHRADIFAARREHAAYCRRAERYIAAAAKPLEDIYDTVEKITDKGKIQRTAHSLAAEYLPAKCARDGKNINCRLSAVTLDGIMYCKNTPKQLCGNTVVICDEYGAASNLLLSAMRKEALARGCRVITAVNPIFPNTVIDAVMLPDAKIAFCCENRYMHPVTDNRRIHSRRYTAVCDLKAHRQKLNFGKKMAEEMLAEAAFSMKAANISHRKLERFYIEAMDFDKITEVGDKLCRKIFE